MTWSSLSIVLLFDRPGAWGKCNPVMQVCSFTYSGRFQFACRELAKATHWLSSTSNHWCKMECSVWDVFCPEDVEEFSPGFQPISADLVQGASMGEWFCPGGTARW